MTSSFYDRAECLRRAEGAEWRGQSAPTEVGRAYCFDEARWWRSLALVAQDEVEIAPADPASKDADPP